MKTTTKFFVSCLLCFTLTLLTGCSSQTATDTASSDGVQTQGCNGTYLLLSASNQPAQNHAANSATVLTLVSPIDVRIEDFLPTPILVESTPPTSLIPRTLAEVAGNEFLGPIFSPDGKRILARRSETIEIWDTESMRNLRTLERRVTGMSGHSAATFSPCGKRIIAWTTIGGGRPEQRNHNFLDERQIIKIWDTESGRELLRLEGKFNHNSRFSPDGKTFLAVEEIWTTQRPERDFGIRTGNTDARGNPLPLYLGNIIFQLWDVE